MQWLGRVLGLCDDKLAFAGIISPSSYFPSGAMRESWNSARRTAGRSSAGSTTRKRKPPRRADFHLKTKNEKRKKARRVRLHSGFRASRRSLAQPRIRPQTKLVPVIRTTTIFLLLSVGSLNLYDGSLRGLNTAHAIGPVAAEAAMSQRVAPTTGDGVTNMTAERVPAFLQSSLVASQITIAQSVSNHSARKTSSTFLVSEIGKRKSEKDRFASAFEKKSAYQFASLNARSDFPSEMKRVGIANDLPMTRLNDAERLRSPEGMSLVVLPNPLAATPKIGLRWERLALVETGSVGAALFGFRKFDEFFGPASGDRPFRLGSDWSSDHTLHFDELLHFQGSYRITQGLVGLYHWSGIKSPWAECIGAGTAATVMTYLEYVDGRRPKAKHKASYSDFLANLLGVGFALAKPRIAWLQDFDIRLSYRTPMDVFQQQTLLKYDRMTHWLTYSLKRQWKAPLHVGLGYGIREAFKPNVQSEWYLGIGFTPVDLLERYYPSAARPLAWLGIYHLGWQVQIK
jgi:hypothetical protein